MWLITTFGYFSIVEKNADRQAGTLTIRCRVRRDLETLKQRYLPRLRAMDDSSGADYPYRATARRADVAQAFAQAIMDVTYSNIKAEIAGQQGIDRARICSEAWMKMRKLQELDAVAWSNPMVGQRQLANPIESA